MNRLWQAAHDNGGKTLLGAAVYFYDPIFLEICAHLGYKAIWIEMEHGHITFAEAADLCRMAAGSGMLTMIRIPDVERANVLKAAECGPDILDVPMIERPEQMHDLRKYARFAPEGSRGFFSVSRAINFGIPGGVVARQKNLNSDLCLMAQIETVDAMARLDELVAVEDVDIFIGPADLAASLGHPGETGHPDVKTAAARIVHTARRHNKCVATACAPEDYPFWLDLGIDLLFCTNDIACLKLAAGDLLSKAREIRDCKTTAVQCVSTAADATLQNVSRQPGLRLAR
ncbi:MAG: aldolase/citrate lyase family protein [Terracidiphilus sp.]|jgi:2-keto-3-deoxy-L-rhamnonate aldolase RhmA